MKYEVLNPISYMGSRLERGETVEMAEEEAFNIGKDYLKAVEVEKKEEKKVKKEKTAKEKKTK